MRVSPISIQKQEFNKSFRGYDKEEVRAYLERLSDEFEAIQKENDSLKKELEKVSVKLSEFNKIEKNLQETLLKAQESSSKSIESTKKQTNLMIKEAELKAAQILEKARKKTNEIRNSVIFLREERDLLVARLKAMISSQAQLFESKVENAVSETEDVQIKERIEQAKKVNLNIDDIVNKLL